MKCKYNDCGWCYAPANTATNDEQGQCLEPSQCPERQRQPHELIRKSNAKEDDEKPSTATALAQQGSDSWS